LVSKTRFPTPKPGVAHARTTPEYRPIYRLAEAQTTEYK
jgi:hypothetical protein